MQIVVEEAKQMYLNQAEGKTCTLNELDKSFKYREKLVNYIRRGGRISREARNTFKELSEKTSNEP